MRSVSARSSAPVSVRVVPSSPSQTTARRRVGRQAVETHVAALVRPPTNHVAHAIPSDVSRTGVYGVSNGAEEAHDRVPEPLRLVDRTRDERRESRRRPRRP